MSFLTEYESDDLNCIGKILVQGQWIQVCPGESPDIDEDSAAFTIEDESQGGYVQLHVRTSEIGAVVLVPGIHEVLLGWLCENACLVDPLYTLRVDRRTDPREPGEVEEFVLQTGGQQENSFYKAFHEDRIAKDLMGGLRISRSDKRATWEEMENEPPYSQRFVIAELVLANN